MVFSFDRIRFLLYDESLYGAHSGYPLLARAVREQIPETEAVVLRHSAHRVRRKLLSIFAPRRFEQSKFWWSEQVFMENGNPKPDTIYHSLNFNVTPTLWQRYPGRRNLVATLHYSDPSNLSPTQRSALGHVRSGITLAEDHLQFYRDLCPQGRVEFVHHGVDINFFRPSSRRSAQRRLLFVGRVARDFEMLANVLETLSASHPGLAADLVLPIEIAENELGDRLRAVPGVTVHNNISDDALLRLYQNAYLLLLPLIEASANNSIVEAMAAGLPVVTTNASGVRSYGGGTIYPVVELGDVDGMVRLVVRYLADLAFRDLVAAQSRAFAEEYLDWEKSARAHLQVYERLVQ